MQNNISSEMQRSNLRLRVEKSSRYGVLSELPVVFLLLILKTIAIHCRLFIWCFMHPLIFYASGLTGGHTCINYSLKPSFNQVKWLFSFKYNALSKWWTFFKHVHTTELRIISCDMITFLKETEVGKWFSRPDLNSISVKRSQTQK